MAKDTMDFSTRLFLFANENDAWDAVGRITILFETYHQITIADFKRLVGGAPMIGDLDYGWTSIEGILPVRGTYGYYLDFPHPEALG